MKMERLVTMNREIFFLAFSFEAANIMFVPFLYGCRRKFCFSMHYVCIILGFCLKCSKNLCSWDVSVWMPCSSYYQRKALMSYSSILASGIVEERLLPSAWSDYQLPLSFGRTILFSCLYPSSAIYLHHVPSPMLQSFVSRDEHKFPLLQHSKTRKSKSSSLKPEETMKHAHRGVSQTGLAGKGSITRDGYGTTNTDFSEGTGNWPRVR